MMSTKEQQDTYLQQQSLLQCIGNTPLFPFSDINTPLCQHFLKAEFLNPSGSTKDRMAHYIVDKAERNALLKPGFTIVENSSGNTGTALAMIAAIKGYSCKITMPDKMSTEKQNLIRSYGAEVIITPTDVPADSPESYYSVARRIASETPNSYYPDQYNNPWNIEAHYLSTGPEIWQQTQGKITALVAGIGTGGTISGVGRYLKEQNPNVKIIAVDPVGSVFYDYFKTGKVSKPEVYQVEGIGEDYLVKALDFNIIDDIIQVNDQDSFLMARQLAQKGIFAGGSSGSALWGAQQFAKQCKEKEIIITILPDSGNRYLSKVFNLNWMKKQGYLK